jgi:hypothetical protein
MFSRVNVALDLSCADMIEVEAREAGAHLSLLARQLPGPCFTLVRDEAAACPDTVRVLWAPDGLDHGWPAGALGRFDALVTTHVPDALPDVLRLTAGFARVAAVRDVGEGRALAVFGRGLTRALFRAGVRGHKAA